MTRESQTLLLGTVKFTNTRKGKSGVNRTGIIMPDKFGAFGEYVRRFVDANDMTILTFKNRVGIPAELFTNLLSENATLSDKHHDSILSYVRGRLGGNFDKVAWAKAVADIYHADGTPLMNIMREVMLATSMGHDEVASHLKLTSPYLSRILKGTALLKSDISVNLITYGQRYIKCDSIRSRFMDTVTAACQLPNDAVLVGRIEGLTGTQKKSVLSLITKLEAINRA